MLDRYISQAPRDDGAFTAETYCPSKAVHISRIQKVITQFDQVHNDGNEPTTPCLFSFAGCPFSCSAKSSWTYHVRQCHLQTCSCIRTKSCTQSPTAISFSFDDHVFPMLRKCLVSGCPKEISGEVLQEEWLDHLYTHLQQHSTQTFEALECNKEFLGWSSRPDTGIIQEVAGNWTLCKCLCRTLEDSKTFVLPPSPESPLPMDSSSYAFSRPSQAKDDVFSRKSLPTCTAGTDSTPSFSNHEGSLGSLEIELVSRSDLLDEFVHFTISWFSAWLASQPGNRELNPGSQSNQGHNSGSQGEATQGRKRKARGQNDKNRGERKARRLDSSNEGEPDDDDNGGPSTAEGAPPGVNDEKYLACPYYKRNPSYYRQGRFSLCESGGWKTYHRVREHMKRKHLRPNHLCERCFADFEDDASLQRHLALQCAGDRNDLCPYDLSSTQWEQLRAASAHTHKKPEAEKWKQMYRILFPGENIPDPYKNPLSCHEQVMSLLANLQSIISNNPHAAQDLLGTFASMIPVATQAIRDSSGTAREHDAQGNDSPENGIDIPPAIDASHGATEHAPGHDHHYPGYQLQEPSAVSSASFLALGADMYVAAANEWIDSWSSLEGAPDLAEFAHDQPRAPLSNLLGELTETTVSANGYDGSRIFDELQEPPGATNDHADYQHDPWLPAFNPLRMPSDRAGLLDDQDALETFNEGGRDPATTALEGHQYAFDGCEGVPDAPDNMEDLDDAWLFEDDNAGND